MFEIANLFVSVFKKFKDYWKFYLNFVTGMKPCQKDHPWLILDQT